MLYKIFTAFLVNLEFRFENHQLIKISGKLTKHKHSLQISKTSRATIQPSNQTKGAVPNEKIADVVENMGQTVTKGYKAIETGVVSGYKKIENGAVTGFERVSDKCVDVLFAREGETVEEAKARLAANRKTKD